MVSSLAQTMTIIVSMVSSLAQTMTIIVDSRYHWILTYVYFFQWFIFNCFSTGVIGVGVG